MRIKSKNFCFELSYPALALAAVIVISNVNTGYLLCFFAVLIHECGHLIAMKLCGLSPKGIKISAFNIEIVEQNRHSADFRSDIVVTAAGPLANFIAFITAFSFSHNFALINLLLGAFNLLPAASMDGGQLLYLFLLKRFTSKQSAKMVDIATIISAVPLFFAGILILLNSHYNFSLLFLSMYLVLSIFIRKDKYL